MKNEKILYALSDIRADFIEEAAPVRRRSVRKLLTLAAAAAAALLLMGAGIIYGDSVQSWMAGRWAWENGGSMGDGQTALVDSMSQEIGQSKTVGNITVDVDSALFGDRGFKVLLRVRGREFKRGEGIWFKDSTMELDPDPTLGMGNGRGLGFAGIDTDGSLLLFLKCYWDEPKRPDGPVMVRLTLTDLVRTGGGGIVEEILQAGTWDFEFPLEITGVPEAVSLPDCTVTGHDPATGAKVELELKNLMLYSTGISYEKTGMGDFEVTVILEDGSSIAATLGIGDSRWWDVPVDPAEVQSVRIGETEITLP